MGIPLIAALIFQCRSRAALDLQVRRFQAQEAHGLYLQAWILTKDVAEGKKIKKPDLVKKKIWVPDTEHMQAYLPVEQISGKKAKAALRKGTAVQANLLYDE